MTRKVSPSSQSGMTLIEIALVLAIIGLIVAAVLTKGTQLLEQVRLHRTQEEMHELLYAISSFKEKTGSLPGTIPEEGEAGKVSDFWQDLLQGGFSRKLKKSATNKPQSTIGGVFALAFDKDMQGWWLILSAEKDGLVGYGLLTPRQAHLIAGGFREEKVRVRPGQGLSSKDSCIDPSSSKKECVVQIWVGP